MISSVLEVAKNVFNGGHRLGFAHTNSMIDRLNRSAIPFWDGEYGAVVSMVIPSSSANFRIFSFTNSGDYSI